MDKHALAVLPRLEAKAYVIAFAAVDVPGFEFSFKQGVAGIEIG